MTQPSPSRQTMIVLGAGLAGLRAAVELLERGHRVIVLERESEPGGMARSHRHGDFVFDHGPHGFFTQQEWLREEFERLMAEEEGGYRWLTKWSQIHYRDEYFNFPLRLVDIVSKLNPLTVVGAGLSFLWSRARRRVTGREPANAEEYLIDQFGRVLYNAFFGPYTRKAWDIDPKDLDADFTRDRVPALHLWDVLRKLFTDPAKEQHRTTPSGRIITHDLHHFYYPTRGAGALPHAYARWARRLGAELRFDVTVERIDTAARTVSGSAGNESFELAYDGAVSTIPLDDLVPLLTPTPPAEIRLLAAGLRYRAILLVNVAVKKPEIIGPFWIYFTNRFFNRISEYRHFSPELAPEGKTGICFEIGCHVGDALWNAPDVEIVRRCVRDVAELGLAGMEDVEDYWVVRESHAYPLYETGYRARLSRLIGWVEGSARVMTAGRQGRFLYINQDAAIESGKEAGVAASELLRTGMVRPLDDAAAARPVRKVVR